MPKVRDIVDFLRATGLTETSLPHDAPLGEVEIERIDTDEAAVAGTLVWISPRVMAADPARAERTRASLVLQPIGGPPPSATTARLACAKPKLAFARAVHEFFPAITAIRWPAAAAGAVATGSQIGRDVVLAPGVVIGPNVSIGDGASIGPNTCIANTTVGADVVIGASCSIGLPGFGYVPDDEGRQWRFPHTGRVVIEDRVEIGSNTCIDRGALGVTSLGAGCKVDNLVHIAHNVTVGADALVIAHAMIGGSTRIGPRAWIAPSAALMNQISIGEGAIIGLAAVVLKDVADGETVVGNPGKALKKRES